MLMEICPKSENSLLIYLHNCFRLHSSAGLPYMSCGSQTQNGILFLYPPSPSLSSLSQFKNDF